MPTRTPAKALRAGSLFLCLLPFVGCQDLTPVETFTSVVSMSVKPAEAELKDGQSMHFEPVLLDQNGKPLKSLPSGMSLRWSVSDAVVASIDQSGAVVARRPGLVTVTAELVSSATGNVIPSASVDPAGGPGSNTHGQGKGNGLSGTASLDVKAVPRTMEYVSGDAQSAVTGSILPDSLAVRLLDRNGLPVAGVPVSFVVTSGNGYVSPSSATTDSAGISYAHWALGYALGDQTVEASVNGVKGSPTTFHATAVAGAPAALVAVSGDLQNGTAGQKLPAALEVKVRDQFGNPVAGVPVSWSASSGSLSPISGVSDADGLVATSWTLGSTLGESTATARSAGLTSVTFIATTLRAAVALIRLVPDSLSLQVGQVAAVTAAAFDASGAPLDGVRFAWSSSDAQTAKVDSAGRVTGVGGGSARVSASAAGVTTSIPVVVQDMVASIALSPSSANLTPGSDTVLSAVAKNAAGGNVQGVTFTWASSKAAVATVDASGRVTAVAIGTATITASADGHSGSASISVQKASSGTTVSSVVVSPSADTLNAIGDTLQLSASGYDASSNLVQGARVTWTSSNPATAVVDSMGRVVAKAVGSTLIVATSLCCQVADTAGVQIRQIVKTVQLSPASTTLAVGGVRQFSATPVDSNGVAVSSVTVTWSSSAPGIASVSTTGVVSGVAAGSATITAQVSGIKASGAVTVTSGSTTGGGDFVTYPNDKIAFIIGPQLKIGSALNPWPFFDQNELDHGLKMCSSFEASPTQEGAYYDLALTMYIAYYRSGDSRFRDCARFVADWEYSRLASQGNSFAAPRGAAVEGMSLRALDGRPQMLDSIAAYVDYEGWIWLDLRTGYDHLHYGVRDGGYALLNLAIMSVVAPDYVPGHGDFLTRAHTAAADYYARLQYPDGSWRWTDPDDPPEPGATGDDFENPFHVGLLLQGMIAVHWLTGDPVVANSIEKAVTHLYRDAYRKDELVPGLSGVRWRGMWVYLFCDVCPAGTTALRDGWDTNSIREVREITAPTVHAFGYAYYITRDKAYLDMGDEMAAATWGHGVGPLTDAYYSLMDYIAKDYNQNYRAGGQYLAWRVLQ